MLVHVSIYQSSILGTYLLTHSQVYLELSHCEVVHRSVMCKYSPPHPRPRGRFGQLPGGAT